MAVAVPPGLTRFSFSIRPKDGSAHIHLQCDVDQIVIPEIGTSFGIDVDDDVTIEVRWVCVYPTNDPMVYVEGKTLTVETGAEAKDIARAAERYGWKRIGR